MKQQRSRNSISEEINNSCAEQREIKALLEASNELGVKNLTILTRNEKREISHKGVTINIKPLFEWILE